MSSTLIESIDCLVDTLEDMLPAQQETSTVVNNSYTHISYGNNSVSYIRSKRDDETNGKGLIALLFLVFGSIYVFAKDEYVRFNLRGIDDKMSNIMKMVAETGFTNKMLDFYTATRYYDIWATTYSKRVRNMFWNKIAILLSILVTGVAFRFNEMTSVYIGLASFVITGVYFSWTIWTADLYGYERQDERRLRQFIQSLKAITD